MYTGINLDNVDYEAITLAIMQGVDPRLNDTICDQWATDIIDAMNQDTSNMHALEVELAELEASIRRALGRVIELQGVVTVY